MNFYKARSKRNDNSIILVIAINEKQIRFRTGKAVKSKIYNSQLTDIINGMKGYLRSFDYKGTIEYAIKILCTEMKKENQNKLKAPALVYTLIVLFLGYLLLTFYRWINKKEKYPLNKIRNLLNKNRTNEEVLKSTCLICLIDFDLNSKPKTLNIADFTTSNEPTNTITYNNKIDKDTITRLSLKGRTTLECEHIFHQECINRWIEIEQTCPICAKISLSNTSSNDSFASGFVKIQSILYPLLNFTNITYLENDISWNVEEVFGRVNQMKQDKSFNRTSVENNIIYEEAYYNFDFSVPVQQNAQDTNEAVSACSVGSVGSGGAGGDW